MDGEASDKTLVKRLLAGDEEAFEEFFHGYFPRLYRFALARVDNCPDAAEEITQVTLTKVVSKLGTYRGEARLFTWLCTFCRHEISADWRRENRQPHQVDLIEEIPEIRATLETLLVSSGGGPEERLHRKEIARLVQVTLDHLPPRYGDALEWKYIHGLTVKEIAELLQVGPKAAESLLTRARQAFREGFSALGEPHLALIRS
ncbi:MAG: sigma-70 family RNA polymerase sigma factor [Thermoanaerobaculia bacterium]